MLKSFRQPGTASNSTTDMTRARHTYETPKPAESPKPAETGKTESVTDSEKPAQAENGNKLIVGPNIKLKGSEITDCEILVVEGRVEASMNSRDIRIAEGGVFSGKAEIDVAEIRGTFEGELTARKRLVIYATGKVSGTIRYGAMMVEEGGIVSGDVATLAAGGSQTKAPETAAQTAVNESATESTSEMDQLHASNSQVRNFGGRR